MYSESDLDAAVAAGAVSAESAAALRRFMAARHQSSAVDEEHFRLITGFNDIFVAIASIILMVAMSWFGGKAHAAVGAFAVAATAWGLGEYFTRMRRMALPSILFLVAYAGGLFFGTFYAINPAAPLWRVPDGNVPLTVAALVTVAGAWLHWWRFHVPITVAAGICALVSAIVTVVTGSVGLQTSPVVSVAGVAVFAFAMWWDMSDRARHTRRSDVAFWLHLMAAPLIVHPVFHMLGLLDPQAGMGQAAVAVVLYVVLALVALAVDRRALLVSALFYVLYAIGSLMKALSTGSGFALTALLIGAGLLLLSAFWHSARAKVVGLLPAALQGRLPSIAAVPPPLPAH